MRMQGRQLGTRKASDCSFIVALQGAAVLPNIHFKTVWKEFIEWFGLDVQQYAR